MKYIQIKDTKDTDIPYLASAHALPEVSKFISISENYWTYVTYEKMFHTTRFTAKMC